MKKELNKIYDPGEIEPRIYKMWEDGGFFKPEVNPDGKPYTIVMPPPNITGQLHIGHAFDGTLQDILTRYKRMNGFSALWLPGEDHASIATEVKVVGKIKEETGKTKYDIGREAFLKEAWDWAKFYRNRIATQFRKLGASCDWSRERFTMDDECVKAVNKTFINLYNKGLIYKANRIINWCPVCKTALSDAEVEYTEQEGNLWYIKYPLKEGGFLTVATTRPETMLGDSAVAINPNDERMSHLKGKTVLLPLTEREIPIIEDDFVDIGFGTGCVKVTPCHDPNDFEMGVRHNLEQHLILDEEAKIKEGYKKYSGLDRYEARKVIAKDLEELGLIEKIEHHSHNVGECYRCHTTIEPITSLQWFVKMAPLAKPAIEAVKEKETNFVPDRFKKIYFNWMENIRDWCISRQLWWGHQIPAYYCEDCGEIIVAEEAPTKCPKCSSDKFRRDEDVLDTWFSSALWPFSTLGWPEKTADLEKFYPNNVLVTGFDIIFFWVARMIFSGIEQMGETPFEHVYIHGLVRDEQGRKMSKSLGNGVDPLDVIANYGADALRFTLVTGNQAGNDTRWHEAKCVASRNFANKINNAGRFIQMNMGEEEPTKPREAELGIHDKWILSRFNTVAREVSANIEKFELGIAAEKIYDFIWNEFCDWYIELSKNSLANETTKNATLYTLKEVYLGSLKLLHPYMPFITEEIYDILSGDDQPIIVAKWPTFSIEDIYLEEVGTIEKVIEITKLIRNLKKDMDIAPSKKINIIAVAKDDCAKEFFTCAKDLLAKIANVENTEIKEVFSDDGAATLVSSVGTIYIPLDELIDKEKEILRLKTQQAKLEGEVKRIEGKLSNEGFVAKAPAKVVEAEKEKLAGYKAMLEETNRNLLKLK